MFNEKLSIGGDLREHLNKKIKYMDELTEQDAPLPDKIAIGAVFATLNSQYDGIVTAMEAWSNERLTFNSVRAKLIEEYEKKKTMDERRSFGQRRSQKFDTNVFDHQTAGSSFKCFGCGKEGHIRRNCSKNGNTTDLREKLNYIRDVEKEEENKFHPSAKMSRYSDWYEKSFNANDWIIDSGSTMHICKDKRLFESFDEVEWGDITIANGSKTPAKGKGIVRLKVKTKDDILNVRLSDVLWVPGIDSNLISVNKLGQKGLKVSFSENQCYVESKNEIDVIGSFRHGLYRLNIFDVSVKVANVAEMCIHQWHKRLSHRNLADIKRMSTKYLKIKKCECSDQCEACIIGKIARKPFRESTTKYKHLECIVTDLCGPMQVKSLGRNNYFITLTDMYSRYTEVEFVKEKSETCGVIKAYIERLKTRFGKAPTILRSDRGKEFMNKALENYLTENGVTRQFTVGYAPEQNGVAERKNRSIVEAARTMIVAAEVNKNLWGEAVRTANHTLNRIPNSESGVTPYEMFYGKKPSYIEMHEFGSEALVMIPYEKRRKWDNKAERMKFLGFDDEAKGFRMLSEKNKVVVSRDVHFIESSWVSIRDKETKENNMPEHSEIENVGADYTEKEEENEEYLDARENDVDMLTQEEVNNDHDGVEVQEEFVQEPLRRSNRSNFGIPPSRYLYKTELEADPKTLKEVMQSRFKNEWLAAMKEELKTIEENETWELTSLPAGRKAIGSKWVFKTKYDSDNNAVRRKARLVAQGYSQKFGVDYDEVFAPVARSSTFRMLLAVTGTKGYKLRQYDVKAAFLNGTLTEEVYMKQAPGFQTGEEVCRLKKSLYGLKQAARVWNQTFDETLKELEYEQCWADKCLYRRVNKDKVCYIIIHVDDMLISTNSDDMLTELEKGIGNKFELKCLGDARHFLGIDIEENEGNFSISQPQYISNIVKEANLELLTPSKTPLDPNYFKKNGNELDNNTEYRKLIGMLLYVSTNSRPDVSAAVGILSKKVQKPTDVDMQEVKRLIRYLNDTREMKLRMNDRTSDEGMIAYSDANWGEDPKDRKSTSGSIVMVNGGTISWWSKKQNVIALSSCESEYIAMTETCKEIVWLRNIAIFFNVRIAETITILTDSQSCMAIIQNEKHSSRTKHIDIKYHFVRKEVEEKRVKLKYVSTDMNIADMLTKPLGPTKIQQLREMAGLRAIPS